MFCRNAILRDHVTKIYGFVPEKDHLFLVYFIYTIFVVIARCLSFVLIWAVFALGSLTLPSASVNEIPSSKTRYYYILEVRIFTIVCLASESNVACPLFQQISMMTRGLALGVKKVFF